VFDNITGYSVPALQRVFGTLWRGFEVFCNLVNRFWIAFGVALLSGMWVMLVLNCIGRWTDAFSVGWTFELLGYMVAWSIFIMAGPITRWDAHIKVSMVPDRLLGEERGAAFMHAVENFVGLGFCIYLSVHAFRFIKLVYDQHWVEKGSVGWDYPMWILYLGILVGFFVSSLFYFERTVIWIRKLFIHEEVNGGSSPSEILIGDTTEETHFTQ